MRQMRKGRSHAMGLPAVPTVRQPHPGQSTYGPPAVTFEVDAEGLKRGR